jgi:hypothetical protein
MSTSTVDLERGAAERYATLKLSSSAQGQVLSARVPLNLSEEDFSRVTRSAYELVNKLTGCNCLSGRISFVVEDIFADVIRVNLDKPGFGR